MKRTLTAFFGLLIMTAPSLLAQSTDSTLPATSSETSSESSFNLHGQILDGENGEPLAYATVSVGKLGIGTGSNMDGNWSMQVPASAANELVTFSFMGYSSKSIRVAELSSGIAVRLQPKSYQMSEVIIVPYDFCKDFLKKAWDAIPTNYPVEPTLCQGFYRETERLKDSTFLYFNEAILNVYKNTYRNNVNFGQIEVEKSRKNVFPGIDSINSVRFYGGPHFPNDLDIVFGRWDFIKPSEYKNWKIELAGSFQDSLNTIYVLTFKNKKLPNSNFQGKMFIDRDSYAFIGFEFWRAGLSNLSYGEIPAGMEYVPGMTTIKIGYTEMNDKYHLGFINYKTSGMNTVSRKRIFKDYEYVTTSIRTDSVSPIPFSKQFESTAILSIEATPYDSAYWKDYNILEESKIMNKQASLAYQKEEALEQLTKVYNRELTEEEKIMLFLKRFKFDGGFGILPIGYQGATVMLNYDGTDLGNQTFEAVPFGITTMDGVRYELTKKWFLSAYIATALYGVEQIQYDLGAGYRMSLAPRGRWVFLDLGLAASRKQTKLEVCSFANPSTSLTMGGKTFDSETLLLKTGVSGWGLRPSLALSVRMGKQYELFGEASWFQPIFKKEYWQIKEAEGFFLSRKSITVPSYRSSTDPITIGSFNLLNLTQDPGLKVSPWTFRIGIRSGF